MHSAKWLGIQCVLEKKDIVTQMNWHPNTGLGWGWGGGIYFLIAKVEV